MGVVWIGHGEGIIARSRWGCIGLIPVEIAADEGLYPFVDEIVWGVSRRIAGDEGIHTLVNGLGWG